MKATRRRPRRIDALASPDAVRRLFGQLQTALPEIIPPREKDLVRMLRAARHLQRYAATDTKRGRPGRWGREELLTVATRLGEILDRETSSRLSVASFIDHYLRLLDFPADVIAVLAAGDINLFEAEQLARITPNRLDALPTQSKRLRLDLLSTHLQTKASGTRLRQRVNELLKGIHPTATQSDSATAEFEDLEDFDPYDPTHLFWEQIKQLGFAFRDIRRADVSDEEVEELLRASEPVMSVLSKIQRRKEQQNIPKLRL